MPSDPKSWPDNATDWNDYDGNGHPIEMTDCTDTDYNSDGDIYWDDEPRMSNAAAVAILLDHAMIDIYDGLFPIGNELAMLGFRN